MDDGWGDTGNENDDDDDDDIPIIHRPVFFILPTK